MDMVITPLIFVGESSHLYCNKAFVKEIGYTVDQIPDKEAWFEKAYPDEAYRKEVTTQWDIALQKAQSLDQTHTHLIAKICCANGQFRWFDIHENIYGNSKVVTFLDIDELQESNDELTNVLKQKDILLSIIAHDVRSPLSNIKQIIDNYKVMDLSEQEVEEVFTTMGTQIDYIFNIINSLLIRTSADRGSFIEKREQVDLKLFFLKYSGYYGERMDKQNIHFVYEIADETILRFDPFILDVICRNLIDNAIKYSPENGNIYISFEKKKDGAEIIIRDTGPGMSAEQSDRILHNKGSRRLKNQITDSFGLGLVMAKEILEGHGGKLSIRSELGKGTSFVIFLSGT